MEEDRRKRSTLKPADERRALTAEAALASACDSAEDAREAVERFVADVDSDRLGGGVVLEPLADEDSLVQHIEEGAEAVSRAQAGRRT